MHNRIGHRFQRRLDVPNWLEPKTPESIPYNERVLATEPANLLAYWMLDELAGVTADNAEGTAARDGTYLNGFTLGQPGIGDGRTSTLFDGVDGSVNVYSANLAGVFDGDEGTAMLWAKVINVGVWTDGTRRKAINLETIDSHIALTKDSTNNTSEFTHHAPPAGFLTRDRGGIVTTDWYHLAITWSKIVDEVRAYFDGVQVGATLAGMGNWTNPISVNAAQIGGRFAGGFEPFDGYMAHVPIWDIPLSQPQIANLAVA